MAFSFKWSCTFTFFHQESVYVLAISPMHAKCHAHLSIYVATLITFGDIIKIASGNCGLLHCDAV